MKKFIFLLIYLICICDIFAVDLEVQPEIFIDKDSIYVRLLLENNQKKEPIFISLSDWYFEYDDICNIKTYSFAPKFLMNSIYLVSDTCKEIRGGIACGVIDYFSDNIPYLITIEPKDSVVINISLRNNFEELRPDSEHNLYIELGISNYEYLSEFSRVLQIDLFNYIESKKRYNICLSQDQPSSYFTSNLYYSNPKYNIDKSRILRLAFLNSYIFQTKILVKGNN